MTIAALRPGTLGRVRTPLIRTFPLEKLTCSSVGRDEVCGICADDPTLKTKAIIAVVGNILIRETILPRRAEVARIAVYKKSSLRAASSLGHCTRTEAPQL